MKSNFELQQIEKFKRLKGNKGVVLGPGDDAAILKSVDPNKEQLVFCGDMLIEGVHFNLDQADFAEVGHKAVGRTISDIAAMGAQPLYLGFSLALPKKQRKNIDEILKGALTLLNKFNCSLVGGDMSVADKIFCDTWCIGKVQKNKFKIRSGLKKNDAIFVSGALGGSYESKRHLSFTPCVEQAKQLIENYPINAMIDISDGFIFDLYRMLIDSSVSVRVYENNIPCNKKATLKNALYDGEDYQLLFSANKRYIKKLVADGFYYVGDVADGKGKVVLVSKNGNEKVAKIKGFSSLT